MGREAAGKEVVNSADGASDTKPAAGEAAGKADAKPGKAGKSDMPKRAGKAGRAGKSERTQQTLDTSQLLKKKDDRNGSV